MPPPPTIAPAAATARPVVFNAEQVRAAMARTKTQHRVPVKPQPPLHWSIPPARLYEGFLNRFGCSPDEFSIRCPFAVGDLIWVRETWQTHCDMDRIAPADLPVSCAVQYPATYDGWVSKRRSALHMPRWAARLFPVTTDVRVHRIQDISEADAMAEGIAYDVSKPDGAPLPRFRKYWDSLHGKGAWDRNDWVWALTFRIPDGTKLNRSIR